MRNGISGLALLSMSSALAIGIVVAASAVAPARAGIEYPWCAVYSESTVGATNCGFSTLAQCRATISGIGGMCQPNPAYGVSKPQPKRRSQPR